MREQPAATALSLNAGANSRRSLLLDALCVLGGILLILTICLVLSRGRILWEDEVLGLTLLRDPSWTHMLREWSGGADNGGILFYVSARLWLQLFGTSALAFRMYSATGFGAAFAVLWITLRRYYSRGTLTIALCGVWFLGPQVVAHICEGRFYGLFLFAAMLTLFVTLRLAQLGSGDEGPHARTPAIWLLLTFLAHAMLVTSHLLGLVYSVFFVAALIVCHAVRRHPDEPLRWRIYLSVVPAWLLLIVEHTAIKSALNNGKPHYWASRPGLHQLFGAYHAFDVNVNRALLLIAFVLALVVWRCSFQLAAIVRQSLRSRTELYIVVLALALVPFAFFAESWMGTPIFVNRYLLPVTVVSIVFAAEAMRLIHSTLATQGWSPRYSGVSMPAAAALLAGLLVWIFIRLPHSIPQRQDYTQALTAALPSGSVVVLPDGLAYTEIIARQYNAPVHFQYLLNWQRSIAPAAPKADVSQFHLLSGWKHAGYFPGSVEDQSSFLETHPAFFVLETRFDEEEPDPAATETVLASLAKTPGETVQSYPSIKLPGVEDRVWLVCRSTCPSTM